MADRYSVRRAAADDALPRGRLSLDLKGPTVLLRTVQSADPVDQLLSTGILRPDPARAEPDFAEAYAWMYAQPNERLVTSGDGALWFWARIRRVDLLAELRRRVGDLLLTCRSPRQRVMLSHFQEWHLVPVRELAGHGPLAGGIGRRGGHPPHRTPHLRTAAEHDVVVCDAAQTDPG